VSAPAAGQGDPVRVLAAYYADSAGDYDRWWSPVLRPMAEHLVRALPLRHAARVLDVGSGVGGLTSVLRTAAPDAVVIGVDASEGMLRLARAAALGPVGAMDAQALAIRTANIDVAVCAFVLFHLPDPGRGVRELVRVLRPGGAVGTVTWGENRDAPLVEIWTEELEAHGAGPDPMPAAVQHHVMVDAPAKVSALLEAGGFVQVRAWSVWFKHQWEREHLFALRQGFGKPKRRLQSLAPDVRAACLARIRERLDRAPSHGLLHRPEVVFGTARRVG
jgi:ubiquinone/menaquinone biosynthesis C-methylase UbiE